MPKKDVETGEDEPWVLKDLRKTCATYYDEHRLSRRLIDLGDGAEARNDATRFSWAYRHIR